MSVHELTQAVNARGLYHKRDGSPVEVNQRATKAFGEQPKARCARPTRGGRALTVVPSRRHDHASARTPIQQARSLDHLSRRRIDSN